jgi:competence protein ComEC
MLYGWVPVCLGLGIGTYFSLGQEPGALAVMLWAVSATVLLVVWRLLPLPFAPAALGVVIVFAGFGVAKVRVETVAAPVLSFRYYGPVQGRVVHIDRSSSDAVRLTLDDVVLARMSPDRTPERVRVSLHGTQPIADFHAGDLVNLTGHLSPPSGPAEPGGFDFQRHAWFMRLGAVGYTRTPVMRWQPPRQNTFAVRIFGWRMAISKAVQRDMPGEAGAFAAAIMTGDRSGMGQGTLRDLRAANLAHLLAISGLHMGLLTGVIFAMVRYGLAPFLRWPTKKIAAVCAIVVGAFYLMLSGGNVATERAFTMVAVMFIAVLLDRRALTLRAVAIAAVIVLVWQPEAMTGPGFQMSFAATTALVAAFAAMRRFDLTKLPRWMRVIFSVFMSSFIAGIATAPFAAAHFNQIAHFGLIANLLSVPLMGVLVMPAAVLAVCLAPLGLWQVGLWLMEQGLTWILFVARSVASQDGALSHVWAPDPAVLPVLTLGLLWVLLIKGPARIAGLGAVAVAGVMWVQTARPDLLIADSGSLIGLQTTAGRALSKPRGAGFVAGIWLENDGQPVTQEEAAARFGLDIDGRKVTAMIADWRVLQVSGKTALATVAGCDGADILVTNQSDDAARPCIVFDLSRLRRTGALALTLDANGDLLIDTAHRVAGARPWNAALGPRGNVIRIAAGERVENARLTRAFALD